jgi:hypothetical protein
MRTLTTLLAAAAILCFMTSMTQAQTATTGQIVGVVTDPTGAIVVGAKVALTSDAGVRRETTTGSNGRYTFPLLDPWQLSNRSEPERIWHCLSWKAWWCRLPRPQSPTLASR